jgi:hypothetical protein
MKRKSAFSGRILFDHIPKTAGTAVSNWLTDTLGTGCVSPQVNGIHRQLISQYGGLYSIITAHVDFEFDEDLDPRYTYVTCLRHPVDRAISWIYFILEEYESHKENNLFQSITKLIETDGQEINDNIISSISNLYVTHFSKITQTDIIAERISVEYCLTILRQYDLVGLQENLNSFIADLAILIGAPLIEKIAKQRVTSTRPLIISPKLIRKLTEINQLDIQLYEEVKTWHNEEKIYTLPWEKYDIKNKNSVRVTPDLIITKVNLLEGPIIDRGQTMTFEVNFFLVRTLAELNIMINIYDSDKRVVFGTNNIVLHQFQKDIARGSYCVRYSLLADLSVGKYTVGFSFLEILPNNVIELSFNDLLYEFDLRQQIETHYSGYAYLPAKMVLFPIEDEHNLIENPKGSLSLSSPLSTMECEQSIFINVVIENRSEQKWKSDSFRPVNMAFRWSDIHTGTTIIDGARTMLSNDTICPNETTVEKMCIIAPASSGQYCLILSLVQENVGWFDTMGKDFKSTSILVNIL